jgi:uncharacterized protein YjlB
LGAGVKLENYPWAQENVVDTQAIIFPPSEWVPNNGTLPVLIYKDVLTGTDGVSEFEQLFKKNGWSGIWRNGVFDYQHYHSGAHEVLGVGRGSATLLIGGPTGQKIDVSVGDCLVLPAGTGHQNLGSTSDFVVVGAYPPGQQADIQRSRPTNQLLARIAEVELPDSDPVQGSRGYLVSTWCK